MDEKNEKCRWDTRSSLDIGPSKTSHGATKNILKSSGILDGSLHSIQRLFSGRKKHGVGGSLDFYVDMAKAFLEDKDAADDKLLKYYKDIMK